uniref:Uncharacterized protein n=1 Tax=Solanum tuberosum TaxID=4113 RepID=M1DJ90_SOLTU
MSVVNDYEPIEHLSVEVMSFKDSIMTFKQMEGELFHESWLRFKALLIQFPTNEIFDLALLEFFYRSLNPENRGLIDRLISGGLERYSYETAAKFLDLVAKTNKDTEKDQQLIILLGQMDNMTQKIEELEVMSKQKSKCIPPTVQRRTKPKAAERITPAQEKSKGNAIKEDAVTSKGKALKLPKTIGKGKGKRPTPARKTITLDPNTPSWARGFCRAVHVFLADSHSTDLGESDTAIPPEIHSDTDAQAQGEGSGTEAPIDGETA